MTFDSEARIPTVSWQTRLVASLGELPARATRQRNLVTNKAMEIEALEFVDERFGDSSKRCTPR